MSSKRWVQHISGQGEKYQVESEALESWRVYRPGTDLSFYRVPRHEYRLCDPPEQWEDVTKKITVEPMLDGTNLYLDGVKIFLAKEPYRLTYRDGMHNGPHFVIEAKKVG